MPKTNRVVLFLLVCVVFAASRAQAQSLTPPTISQISPAQGAVGATIDAVITGSNLTDVTAISFGGTGVSATLKSGRTDTTLPIQISITANAAGGTRAVFLTAPAGPSNQGNFLVVAPGPWSATGSMGVERGESSATVLLDGSVLVVGGKGPTSTCLASAERYANGVWSVAGFLSQARCFNSATLLPSGKVLVTGDGTAEIYDPGASTWTSVTPMLSVRSGYTATLLSNGRVLMAGGRANSTDLASVELFDPNTRTWAALPSMPEARSGHSDLLLPNGTVLLAGGSSNTAVLFDPISTTWRSTGSLSEARSAPLSFLPDGRVFIAGGNRTVTEIYDPNAGTWTTSGSMSTTRPGGALVTLTSGKVLAMGGRPGTLGPELNTTEMYDPATGLWSAAAPMSRARTGFPAVLLDDNKALVIGSTSGLGAATGASELYDPGISNPSPSLNTITPGIVGSGTTASILLSGTNFLPNSVVRANNVRLVTKYMGSTQLLAFHPGSFLTLGDNLQINIANPAPGGGASGNRTVTVSVPNPAPALTRVSPAGLARVPSLLNVTLTLTGTNFTGSSVVYFNGTALQTTFVSSTSLSAVVPASALSPGGFGIVVFNPQPGGGSSSVLSFIVVGKWNLTGSMPDYRTRAASTLLSDGRVFLTGGEVDAAIPAQNPLGSQPDAGSEIFDPVSGTWTMAASMPSTREAHTATLLANGKVLVVGGSVLSSPGRVLLNDLSSAILYDAATNTWSATGSMSVARAGHTATLLPDGRVLVAGGSSIGTLLASSEIYDPATGNWGTLRTMTAARSEHTATRLSDGAVIVAGGYQTGGEQNRVESYDPVSNSWRLLASMNSVRSKHSASLLSDGRLLVTGGQALVGPSTFNLATAEIYDPRTNTWVSTPPMSAARGQHSSVRLPTGQILVFGSAPAPQTGSELFDPETGTWTTTAPLNYWGQWGQGILLSDGRALAFWGGMRSTEIFEPATTITAVHSFAFPDRGAASFVSAGTLSNVSVGYATIQAEGNASTPAGLAIFGFRENGVLVTETGVPASRLLQSGRVYAELNGLVSTGFAVANPNSTAATISFYFTNLAGVDSGFNSFVLPANQKISVFLNQAPFNGTNVRGTFTFASSVPVTAAVLRGSVNERGDFLIATQPVIDLDVQTSTNTLIFPTFADGGGWTTQVVLVNPGNTVLNGTLQFLNQSGEAVAITTNGQLASTFIYSIPPGSSAFVQTAGLPSSPVSGSVRAIPAAGTIAPSGFVVFSFSQTGIKVTEAGVAALPLSTAFRMYAEYSAAPSWIQSGVAIANPSSSSTTVTLEITRLDGTPTGLTGTLVIPPNGQATSFLREIPGLAGLTAPFQGVVRVSSPTPISAMGLRGRYNERQDFLYTTTPPVDETAPPVFTPLYFPQIVDSGGYSTQFILFSGSPGQASTGTTRIFSSNGEALNWQLK